MTRIAILAAVALTLAACGNSHPDRLTPCQATVIAPYGRLTQLTAPMAYQEMQARCGVPSGR